ncbi:MAG: hypothetical protein HY904_12705 [Deltaproteobacteria bacterium]|nr:hypothetical protein [Deltaproteobacteria bacterium]
MKLMHRGLTIDLPDEDARVAIIEALLFGRSLPPPMKVSVPEDRPRGQDGPPVEITEAMRRFWERLRAVDRKELAMLTHRMHRPDELERALGVNQRRLAGIHSTIARHARAHRVTVPIRTRGRTRRDRRYGLRDEVLPWITALAAER